MGSRQRQMPMKSTLLYMIAIDQSWPRWMKVSWGKKHIEGAITLLQALSDSAGSECQRVVSKQGNGLLRWRALLWPQKSFFSSRWLHVFIIRERDPYAAHRPLGIACLVAGETLLSLALKTETHAFNVGVFTHWCGWDIDVQVNE